MARRALVICFGDSLTVGFQSPTPDNPMGAETPYGRFLQESLGEAAIVRISGVCGECTGEMVKRFRRDTVGLRPDYVLILGGTNDLNRQASPEAIMRNLAAIYELALNGGGMPIPVTVPSIRVDGDRGSQEGREWIGRHLAACRQLNELIRGYAASRNLPYVDLFSATEDPESGLLARIYSNDGLHLTTAGYRLFADHVVRVLRPLLREGASS